MKLNLGAADRHIEDFLCVDVAPPPCERCDALLYEGLDSDRQYDLSNLWPWRDGSIEEVIALDVCEHIGDVWDPMDRMGDSEARTYSQSERRWNPRRVKSGRIHFMNELHRVLVPGGRATIETPNAARGVGYFQDPTHCSPYCLSTFKYFEKGAFAHTRLSAAYGITAAFKVLSLTESRSNGEDTREEVWKIRAVLETVK